MQTRVRIFSPANDTMPKLPQSAAGLHPPPSPPLPSSSSQDFLAGENQPQTVARRYFSSGWRPPTCSSMWPFPAKTFKPATILHWHFTAGDKLLNLATKHFLETASSLLQFLLLRLPFNVLDREELSHGPEQETMTCVPCGTWNRKQQRKGEQKHCLHGTMIIT